MRDGKIPFMAHLIELRRRLMYVGGFFILAFLVIINLMTWNGQWWE